MRRAIESFLLEWKDSIGRMPLIVRGARQIGKSFTIERFGRESFEQLVVCNFEFSPECIACFDTLDPKMIVSRLEAALNITITPGKTLLFIDEIQICPNAIQSLRYFKERLPSLHVIGAGSLLEFVIHQEAFSFPVGRVQFLWMHPLSFVEYLVAVGQQRLVDYMNAVTVDQPQDTLFHDILLKQMRLYALVGGMPSVVDHYIKTSSLVQCQRLLSALLDTYRADFPKYATKAEFNHLQIAFDQVPALVCTQFKYTHISKEVRSGALKIALDQLEWSGLLQRIYSTAAEGIPMSAHAKLDQFKLLFLDVGLVNGATKLDLALAMESDLLQINAGSLAEQLVGQELLTLSDPYMREVLYFWHHSKKNAEAEVDYLVQSGNRLFPIEVKSGTTGSLKSLHFFVKEQGLPFGVRVSQHPFSLHNGVLSIPIYMISQLPRLIRMAIG